MGLLGPPLLTIIASGCSGPQSALDPAGPAAQTIARLWWGMFGFSAVVLVLVCGLWIWAMRRKPTRAYESSGEDRRHPWVLAGGILLPLASVSVLLAVGLPAGQHVATLPSAAEPLRINVTARQWWWQFHYPEAGVTTANQLYLPKDRPIEFYGSAEDVIHAFWVPSLGGKIDLIPGRVNRIRLEATKTGVWRGQCAEFCGTGHAHMIFRVHVLAQPDFAAWLQQRQQPVAVAAEHQPAADAFNDQCGHCHAISGVSAGAQASGQFPAPDLSNIGARRLSGSGRRAQEDMSIFEWLQTHPSHKPNAESPGHRASTPQELNAIATWLETLDQ